MRVIRTIRTPRLPLALVALLVGATVPPAHAQDKVATTAAQFLGLGVGARATAMGGAQVAGVEGPTALYWNPSAIAAMPASGLEFSNSEWLVDTDFQFAALVFDAGALGHFGVSVTNMDYGEDGVTAIDECGPANPTCETGERWAASSLAVGVSYARNLTDKFAVGGTLKFVRDQVWNESANGGALDLGVTYDTGYRGLKIGMSMANFGTDMRLSGVDLRRRVEAADDQAGSNDRLAANLEVDEWAMPLIFRVGVSAVPFRAAGQRLTLAVDGNAPSDQAQSASFGAEYAFREIAFVRGGWRQAFGFDGDDGWTLGFGLRYAFTDRLAGHFDYSFQNLEPFGTPQMFALGFTF